MSPRKGAKAIGRPKVTRTKKATVRAHLEAGVGIRKTAKLAEVGVSTVQRVKLAMALAT